MKISFALFIASLLLISLSAQAYNDPPKDVKCVAACNQKYSSKFRACKEVQQCQAFVQREAGNCIHQCPDAP